MINPTDTLIILTPGFAAEEADTNCLPMQQGFVRTLKEDHPELNIIVIAFQYPYFKKTYQWYGNTVTSFGGKNKGGLARIMRRKKIHSALNKIHRDTRVIGLLSFWLGECAAIGKNFAGRNKLKHCCWILGQDARKDNKYVRYMKAEGRELVALSDFLQDEFERNYGIKPAFVIPSGIDTRRFPAGEIKRDIDILGAGSLIPLKRFDLFIEMLAEIKKQFPSVKAVLAGDGPEKEKLVTLISKYQLNENIRLTGGLAHPDLLGLMQQSRILLHPSSYEGFSGVCQEALAAGTHVISFCRAMKQDIDQWHIVNDNEEMIQKTKQLLQNSSLKYKSVAPFEISDAVKEMMLLFTGQTTKPGL